VVPLAGLPAHPPGPGHWQFPDAALCSASAEFFTWVTDDATAVAAVSGGWPFAGVIAACRPDSAVFSAAVCDGNADFASAANVLASAGTLLSAVCREPRPFLATSGSWHRRPAGEIAASCRGRQVS
jgi:hypothetical protein